MKDRADRVLSMHGYVDTRSKASLLIKEGLVFWNGRKVKRPSEKITSENIEIRTHHIYVGRGAHKLVKALDFFNIEVNGRIAADIGASTGGFSEVLLLNGIKKVFAIDVGHDQLDPRIKNDKRVINLEGVNIKNKYQLPELIDIAVTDLSFISLSLVFPTISSLLKENGELIALIKPQFEQRDKSFVKKGIVKSIELYSIILNRVINSAKDSHLLLNRLTTSPIKGKDGNIEFLGHFYKKDHLETNIEGQIKSVLGELND